MILIVGAGVTGLSVANFLTRDDYLILDKEQEVGGYCRTIKQDGFVWDYSGHFFHFRDDKIKEYLLSRMDRTRIIEVAKSSKIYYKGTLIDFPFQKNIHQLPKEEFIECLYDLYFREENDCSDFRHMLISRFGKAISEKFLIPYNEKVYACDLRFLDKDAMGRFFPHADVGQIIRNFRYRDNASYNSTFTYARGGAFEYIKSLLQRLDPAKIALREELLEVDVGKKLAVTSNRTIHFDALVTTIPLPRFMKLARLDYDPSIYSYSKVAVFNLGFDKKGDSKNHWIYYPQKDISFYRIGYYDNIFGDARMSLYVEIGLKANARVTRERLLPVVLDDLRKVGVISNHVLVSDSFVELDPAYVHINKVCENDRKLKFQLLKTHDIYSIGRYGGWRYCSIEDNIIEAQQIAREL
jgi:protoporphyrinogen oxidase